MFRATILLAFLVANRDFVVGQTERVEVLNGCQWERYENQQKSGGKPFPEAKSEDDCAKTCMTEAGCTDFDYDGNEDPWADTHCWLHHDNPEPIKVSKVKDVHHYSFRNCEARTVILVKAVTNPNEYIFFRGGLDFNDRNDSTCTTDFTRNEGVRDSACSIPIKYNLENYEIEKYPDFSAWSVNDKVLDWEAAEPFQGSFEGRLAQGSPGVWTANEGDRKNALNKYGEHYWLLDVTMDCRDTLDGWFDIKTYRFNKNTNPGAQNGWEKDIAPDQSCKGEAGPSGLQSSNHHAKCGAINIFTENGAECEILNF